VTDPLRRLRAAIGLAPMSATRAKVNCSNNANHGLLAVWVVIDSKRRSLSGLRLGA
jgi:hypothetical protein